MGVLVEMESVLETVKDGKFSVVRFPDYHWDAPVSTGKEPEDFKKSKNKQEKEKKVKRIKE